MGGRLLEEPTMAGRTLDWQAELGRWLKPFLDRLGHKARRRMCPLYVSGLIGPGERKSIAPMAERLALGDYDQLHHFIAAGVWDAAALETELVVQAARLVGGRDAVLVIDDTALPKKGTHSVGVAAQYASALGKTANCQTLVSLTLARGEVPVMLALRLLRAGGCRLWDERTVSAGAHGSQTGLGGGHPASPQGVSCRCADDLAGCPARPSPQAAHTQYPIADSRRPAGNRQMADRQLAHRHEGQAQGSFCCCPRPGRRRTTAADQGQGSTTSAGRRGLAHRRTPNVGREKILPRQPTGDDRPAHLGCHHQGAMDMRTGSSADERRTRL